MSMIKLTLHFDDSVVHVRADAIVSILDRVNHREVMVGSCCYGVKETVEEILMLMDNQYLRQSPIVTLTEKPYTSEERVFPYPGMTSHT